MVRTLVVNVCAYSPVPQMRQGILNGAPKGSIGNCATLASNHAGEEAEEKRSLLFDSVKE